MEGESFADTISEVVPGFLFIGGCNAPTNTGFLLDRGVGFALNVSEEAVRASVDNYLQIKIQDTMTEDLARYYDQTTAFIRRAKESGVAILVYDFSGVSRAPAVVMAYLMLEEKLLLSEALHIIKARRRFVNPNMHFMSILSDLEMRLFGVRSVLVVRDDREKAHLEFPANVELPDLKKKEERSSDSSGDEKKGKKKGKKKKKKEKKQKVAGTLRLKNPAAAAPKEPEVVPVKRLKRDKFAWINDDANYSANKAFESGRKYK